MLYKINMIYSEFCSLTMHDFLCYDFAMSYNFIKYDGHVPRGDTKVGLNKSGLLRLSTGFCRATNIKFFKYAVLFFDDTNKAIAIKPTNSKKEAIFTITNDGTAATISIKSFLKANSIDFKKAKRYDWKKQTLSNIGEVYIIDLDKK